MLDTRRVKEKICQERIHMIERNAKAKIPKYNKDKI